jgi:hypothetical protein
MRHQLLRAQWAAYARYLSQGSHPILVGPWRSEVGFELLYWIPFVHALRHRYKIPPERLIAVGRSGSAAWYQTGGTADLHEHVPVETARVWSVKASQQTGSLKQQALEGWERHVCALTAHSLGITKYHVLSPSWMYRLLAPWWTGKAPQSLLDRYTLQPEKFPAPAIDPDLQSSLPKSYIAMRWYARPTWPYRDDLVLWTRKVVERVAQTTPVVIIDSFHADDHADTHVGDIPNTIRLSQLAEQTPLNSLQIQSAVIARAKGYVGTYGGMAQGAMRWGVPTIALYAEFGQTAYQHLALTQYLSLKTGVPFVCVQPKDIDVAFALLQ